MAVPRVHRARTEAKAVRLRLLPTPSRSLQSLLLPPSRLLHFLLAQLLLCRD
jgi:hypothetical protein